MMDKHAPITEMRVSEKYCPWIDKDLRALMKTRDQLKKAASKRKSQFLMDSYRQVRNKVNTMNTHLKKQYYTDKISSCQGDMRESWKTINELLNKRSKSTNIECLKNLGTETVHKKDISNAMNNFFCSVGKDLANKIPPVPNPFLSGDYEVNKDKAEFNFKTIEVKDIRAAFAKIKTAKSFGTDNIYYIIRCSRMWRHSHCPSPRCFFLFRHFDSENCNLTDVNTNIKTSPNLPYLFITAYFGIYRSREGVMGAFPHPIFSCARPLFPFVPSLKSFVLPLLSHDS